jgi:hypothetical protein
MLKIEKKSDDKNLIVFTLSGRLTTDALKDVEGLFRSERRHIVLDLREITLASAEAVNFLAHVVGEGTELKDCPAYIRQWIEQKKQQPETVTD